jgi:signal transduction histidine kinase
MTSPIPRLRSLPGQILVIAGLALVYFLSARLLISLSVSASGPVTTVWVPSGIAVATLVLAGPWAVIGGFLGSLAVGLHTNLPLPLSFVTSLGNSGGELLCWWLLAGRRGSRFSVEEVVDGLRLAGAAAAAGVLSATVSVGTYVHYGFIPAQAYLSNWLSWAGSGVSSIVLIAPLLVYGVRHATGQLPALARRLGYALALLLVACAAFLWQGPHFQRGVDEPIILLLILGQLWIAFRYPPSAMTLSNCIIAAFAVVSLVMRVGEAPPASAYPFILALQLMLTGLSLIGYLLAAMVQRQLRSTQALQDAQGALVAGARDAGRAEIATNVLHNVGNVLNSVNVSAQLLVARLEASKMPGVARAAEMLDANKDDLGAYLTADARGKLLPRYLGELAKALQQERLELKEELQVLVRSVDHVKEVVATQQTHAGASSVLEPVLLTELVDDALRLDEDALKRAGVTVVRDFEEVPSAPLDKSRILQVLVNLISNARQAMTNGTGTQRLTLRVRRAGHELQVSAIDEGEGIAAEDLTRIFSHGFTTRRGGHGFGLHSAVLTATSMGGSLTAHSDGPGCGATFTLRLPLDAEVAA